MISEPGQQSRRDVFTPTSCIDLLPTLLHMTRQPVPDWCEGEILPPYNPEGASDGREIYAVEAKGSPKYGPLTQATASLIKGGAKLTYYVGYPGQRHLYEFFNIEADPEEMNNLFDVKAQLSEEYLNTLRAKLREAG